MFQEALELEKEYIHYNLQSPILGYNEEDHMEHMRYLANRRMRFMGLPEVYPGARCALPWLDGIIGSIHHEGNFFEVHVKEYQSGGLTWE